MVKNIQIDYQGHEAAPAARILADRLQERGIADAGGGYTVNFIIDPAQKADSFTLADRSDGTVISSGGRLGLIHGAGWFLRQSTFGPDGFEPCCWRGRQKPHCPIRGVYFASHFHNFYHVAPTVEIQRYLEDLALWGYNFIKAIYPMIDLESEDDPECQVNIDRLNRVFSMTHDLGMKTATSLSVNGGYKQFPREFAFTPLKDPTGRRGNSGNMMCPSIPESYALIINYNEQFLRKLDPDSVDLLMVWPYDEGGCACEQCYPWGANGYIRYSKQLFQLARTIFPKALRCVSTWCFDTPYEGEWQALADSLQEEKWCDVILADAHEDFPRYPLEQGTPGALPLINFPEISMWGLFPWGGWGATVLPERFTRLWSQAGHLLSGGFLYSEGIYEDGNKAVVSQLYWQGQAGWRDTLAQYARYELGISDPEPFLEMVRLIEKTHSEIAQSGQCELAESDQAHALAVQLDQGLPEWAKSCWRWRLIFMRTLIDAHRYRLADEQSVSTGENQLKLDRINSKINPNEFWKSVLCDDPPVRAAFQEVVRLFYCRPLDQSDHYHRRVRPVCD